MRPRTRQAGRLPSRLLVTLTAAALLALSIGPASLLAANTRDVYFGSPSGNGTLSFSPVTSGGKTVVTVVIRNDGGQNLNHIKFAGGSTADALPYNPGFPRPGGSSLPAGASFAAVFPSTGCNQLPSSGLMCDVGSLSSGTQAVYTIVISPGAGGTAWLTASWNEGWSTTGANADYTFASGTITVGTAGCTTAAATYFLPDEHVGLANPCQSQKASVSAGAIGGNGGFGSVGIDTTSSSAACPAGYSCFGTTVAVSLAGGATFDDGVEWTIRWEGTKSLKGVIHFHDDYDPTDASTYDVILFQKKFQCSTKLPTNCWMSTASSKGNASPWWFEAVFVTPNNGKAGGFF